MISSATSLAVNIEASNQNDTFGVRTDESLARCPEAPLEVDVFELI